MENEFEVGNLVMLQSGGPLMTVTDVIEGSLIQCTYFTPNYKIRSATLPSKSLVLAEVDGEEDEEECDEVSLEAN